MPGLSFGIYMLEAPNADDYYDSALETDMIRQAAKFNEIPFSARQIHTKSHLQRALNEIGGIPTLLHLAGHGNEDGIGLGIGVDGHATDFVEWNELRSLLVPVNRSVNGTLILCMGSCEGFKALQMAYDVNSELPFLGVIGTNKHPTLAETAIGFATFYHQFYHGRNVHEAVLAMRATSLHEGWMVESAENARQVFVDWLTDFMKSQTAGQPEG